MIHYHWAFFEVVLTFFLVKVGVLLFFSNSPSTGVLLSVSISVLGSLSILKESGTSLLLLLSVLVFGGGVFVIMSFVVFSFSKDMEKVLGKYKVFYSVVCFLLVLLLGKENPSSYNDVFFSGTYLIVFLFILIVLLTFLYSVSSLSEEMKADLLKS